MIQIKSYDEVSWINPHQVLWVRERVERWDMFVTLPDGSEVREPQQRTDTVIQFYGVSQPVAYRDQPTAEIVSAIEAALRGD